MNSFPLLHKIVAGTLLGALGLSSLIANKSSQAVGIQLETEAAITQAMPGAEPKLVVITEKPSTDITATSSAENQPAAAAVAPAAKIQWHTETIKPGDNLSLIFKRAGLNDKDIYELGKDCKEAKNLRKIHPGQSLAFHIEDQQLQELRYQTDRLNSQHFVRGEKAFKAEKVTLKPELRESFQRATITSSLFLAGQKAGLSDGMIMELANIFGWDVDFALDIRQGDSFKVLYNKKTLNGEFIGNGPIMAAEFTNRGKTYKAVRYTHKDGSSQYYTPEGFSMRKAFLRTPVDFARISSHFNLRRKHPVLNRIRAHKGTDYAAPRGTPIRAAGDGKIVHLGRKGGYGKAVVIKHGGAYKTLYAHMNNYKRGLRTGKRIKQGQIIGYVGSTGLATGPHLHYEFYLNGAVRNPVTVKLPKAKSIPKSERQRFEATTKLQVAALQQTEPPIQQLASLDNPNTKRL